MVLNQTLGLNSLRQDLNRLFYSAPIGSQAFAPAYGQAFQPAFYGQAASLYPTSVYGVAPQHGHFVPKANVAETLEGHLITIELPGVELSQVSLRIEGTYLVVEGVRHPGGMIGNQMVTYNVAEGRFGSFRWACPIPNGTMPAGIEATFRNGLLSIALPRVTAQLGLGQLAGTPVAATPVAPVAQVVINPGVNG